MAVVHVRFVGEHPEREFLSPAGVAKYLGVTRRTVYTWIRQGRLKATRTGPKLWLVSMSDLGEFLHPKKSPAPAAPPKPAPAAAPKTLPKAQLSNRSNRSSRKK
jgi:excisionase family DNA binding protein